MLQALGSKEGSKRELRAKRRKKKKDSYAKYLESPTWKKIRRQALDRDGHTCRACKKHAQVVHHIRYPKNLGQERLEWLYSLCAPCHDEIHRLAAQKGVTLRAATRQVLDLSPPVSKKKAGPLPKRIVERRKRRQEKRGGLSRSAHVAANTKKKQRLIDENEKLRETFRMNRERRERRWDLGKTA